MADTGTDSGTRADRRRRLLSTALDLYGTDGYQAVSVERLCHEAGVTTRDAHQEFGDREGLLTALYDQVVYGTVEDIMDALSHAGKSAHDRAHAAISAFVHALLDDPRRGRIQCLEVIGVSPTLEAHRRDVLHRYAQMVDAQGEALGIPVVAGPGGCSLRSLALVGGVNELVIEWLHAVDKPALDLLIDEIVTLFVAAADTPD